MLKKLLILVLVLAFPCVVMAQSGSLSGTITDAENGEPLPGATIFIPDLRQGTSSDLNGEYTIENIEYGSYQVVVSFVGYVTQRRTLNISSSMTNENFALRVDAVGLDEVSITGYAPRLQRELTGSVSTVTAEEIADLPFQSAEALLQGRAAGVNITTTSGEPGAAWRVQIRGAGSINAATEPLYIVDGIPISFSQSPAVASNSPLNSLNPDDIESIEILKDASSAAIYGAQAAAGVVLITTKRGSDGPTQISASIERGSRTAVNFVDYLDRDEYLDYLGEARAFGVGLPHVYSTTNPFAEARANRVGVIRDQFGTPDGPDGELFGDPLGRDLANFSFRDFIFDQGATEKYNLSITGGDSRTSFRISGGYENTDGTVFNSNFSRLNVRSNLDHRFTERFQSSLTLNVARTTRFGICQDGNFINCPPSQAMFEAPFSFPFLPDGEYNPNTGFGLTNNPAIIRDEVSRDVLVTSILAQFSSNFRITDWLSVRGMIGIDYRDTDDKRHDSAIARPAVNGFTVNSFRRVENTIANLVFNGNYTFDNVHNVSGFVGTEYRRDWNQRVTVGCQGYPGTYFVDMNACAEPTQASGLSTEYRFAGYFSNLKYNYDEKYLLSLVARYDGSSRFGADTRWGLFPSISAAWRISEESFFDVSFVDELKLRVGFGTTGNANIGNFAARGLYSASGSYQGATALLPAQLANVNLGWEEAQEINIGLDFAFLEGRINGALDVYRKNTKDLLFDRPLPSDSGFSDIIDNIGSVKNEGIELEISSVNVATTDFTWRSRFNVAFMRNEITGLPDGETIRENFFLSQLEEGRPIGQIYTIKWAGVNPADGRPMWYDADGNITYNPNQTTDAFHYKDGVANQVGGFGNTMSYKNFSLDAFFQFSFGQWAFANTDWFFTRTPDFSMNLDKSVNDRWRQPGDVTYMPRAVLAGGAFPETADFRTQTGTHGIYNASYIRLKSVTVSYRAPRSITEAIGVSSLRVYVSGVNLHTWTAWPFYDPEVAFDPTDIYNNITVASYPTERQVNAGIEIQF